MSVQSVVLVVLVLLCGACARPRGQQLCDAIARRDVATVRQLLAGPAIDPVKRHGTCVPAASVFGVAKPDDRVLTDIGVELVKAGLPANASWLPPGGSEPVWAVEAAARTGNLGLVRALVAVGLDVKSPEATRALVDAAGAGQLPIVTLLVEEGADLEATSGGERPLDRALAHGRLDVVRFLEEIAAARALAAATPPNAG